MRQCQRLMRPEMEKHQIIKSFGGFVRRLNGCEGDSVAHDDRTSLCNQLAPISGISDFILISSRKTFNESRSTISLNL